MTAFRLPPRLLLQDAAALQASLLALRGQPVELEARDVAQLSTPCVQVLLAAARTWRADGRGLALTAPSAEMTSVLAQLAVDPGALQSPEA